MPSREVKITLLRKPDMRRLARGYDRYQEDFNKYRAAKEAINTATEKIGPLKSTHEGVLKQIENGETYLMTAGKCESLLKKASEVRKRTAELEALEAEISKARGEISSIRKVDDKILSNARNIPGEISGLKRSLASSSSVLGLTSRRRSSFRFCQMA